MCPLRVLDPSSCVQCVQTWVCPVCACVCARAFMQCGGVCVRWFVHCGQIIIFSITILSICVRKHTMFSQLLPFIARYGVALRAPVLTPQFLTFFSLCSQAGIPTAPLLSTPLGISPPGLGMYVCVCLIAAHCIRLLYGSVARYPVGCLSLAGASRATVQGYGRGVCVGFRGLG